MTNLIDNVDTLPREKKILAKLQSGDNFFIWAFSTNCLSSIIYNTNNINSNHNNNSGRLLLRWRHLLNGARLMHCGAVVRQQKNRIAEKVIYELIDCPDNNTL